MSDLPSFENLPVPRDDGATAHLSGAQLPAIELPSTKGDYVALRDLVARTLVFVHPSIGGIDDALLESGPRFRGARGCTPEACAVRDRLGSFQSARVDVLGLSGQAAGRHRADRPELNHVTRAARPAASPEVRDQPMTLLIAGHETTATALA